jgi:hypothetical protein
MRNGRQITDKDAGGSIRFLLWGEPGLHQWFGLGDFPRGAVKLSFSRPFISLFFITINVAFKIAG